MQRKMSKVRKAPPQPQPQTQTPPLQQETEPETKKPTETKVKPEPPTEPETKKPNETQEEFIQRVIADEHKRLMFCGMDRLHYHVRQKYPFIIRKTVRDYVSKSETMQRHRPIRKKRASRVLICTKPYERFQMDLTNYALPREGYIINIIDCYSRYAFSRFVLSKHANKIAKFLEDVFSSGNVPKILQMDNAQEHKSEEVKDVCDRYKVKILFSSTYAPTSNAFVERFNKSIKTSLEQNELPLL